MRTGSSVRSGSGTAVATARRSQPLVGGEGGADFDELGQLVELALAHDLAHAPRIGDALLTLG